MRRPLTTTLLLLCSGLAALASVAAVSPAEASPPQRAALLEDKVTRFAATYAGVTYHYDLFVPRGYNLDQRDYPVLFICSPSGNATLGNMAGWVRSNRWLAVMLVEARNGPWEDIDGNFFAAHDDVMRRARVRGDKKFVTGFSGGARMAARFALLGFRPGIAGLFLQGAGFSGIVRYDLHVSSAFGTRDFNLPELPWMRSTLPKTLFNSEIFDGGHEWAPVGTAERALSWLNARFDARTAPHTLTVERSGCGAGVALSELREIDCGSRCSAGFYPGTGAIVTLRAWPTSGTFVGWSGVCTGAGETCVVNMTADRSVGVTFVREGDADCDGVDDWAETNTGVYVSQLDTGTDPQKYDTDGDGWGDGLEVSRGTDPTDPLAHPVVVSFSSIGAQDGWVLESGELSNRGGTLNSTGVSLALGDDALDREYRGILSFDTSSLPDDAVVVRATLKVHAVRTVGGNPFRWPRWALLADVKSGVFGKTNELELSDFQAPAGLRAGTLRNPTADGWYTASLGSASLPYVNRSGPTQIRLRFNKDDNDNRSPEYLLVHSGNAVRTNRPVLEIVYTVP